MNMWNMRSYYMYKCEKHEQMNMRLQKINNAIYIVTPTINDNKFYENKKNIILKRSTSLLAMGKTLS
jgi:hypothetical protein